MDGLPSRGAISHPQHCIVQNTLWGFADVFLCVCVFLCMAWPRGLLDGVRLAPCAVAVLLLGEM